MNKKTYLIIGVLLLIGVLFIAGAYMYNQKQQSNISPPSHIGPTIQPQEEMTQWIDQSEFRFSYPKRLALNPHEEDQVNYAHIELTDADHPGNIVVWTKDTNAKTIEEWWKAQTFDGVLDTVLGTEPAKKALIFGTPSKILISTIRNGYLYQVEAELTDETYWNEIYNQIVSSFTFFSAEKSEDDSAGQTNTAPSTETSSDVEEETIE